MHKSKALLEHFAQLQPSWNSWHELSITMDDLQSIYDTKNRILLIEFTNDNNPTLNSHLLQSIFTLQTKIVEYFNASKPCAPHYIVWTSACEGIFSLGLDLDYILMKLRRNHVKDLRTYIQHCVDVTYINYHNLDLPIINISLLNGNAYGSGIDFALSSDVIIAKDDINMDLIEPQSVLLPAIGLLYYPLKYNINGTYTNALLNHEHLSMNQLVDMHVVNYHYQDTPDQTLTDYITKTHEHFHNIASIYKLQKKTNLLSTRSLEDFTDMWLNCATNLSSKELITLAEIAANHQRFIKTPH